MHIHDNSNSEQGKKELWNAFRGILSASRQGSPLRQISRNGDLPLSFAQQRFWLIHQLEPNSAYNEYVTFLRLEGPLNIVALEESLNEIRCRHEVLRTTFVSVNGQLIQKISPYAPVALSVIDLRKFPHEEREAIAQKQATEEAQQLFDLEQGPLLRVKLLRLKEEEYIFLVTIHHIIYDGWSHGVFIQELSKLYKAFSNSKPSPLTELPIQYADFTQWQREWLQGKILQFQVDYWKQQLSGNLPVLRLPTDRLQPSIPTRQGAYYSQVLPKELIDALKSLSKSEEVTLFMTLLAAFKTLLYRYTRQEDILVGSPIANRNRREISGLIGCFINTLVLRTDLSLNPTFKELLGRIRSVALGAFAHQDLPFEKLVEELQPERDLSRSPLFQVMFVFQNAPTSSLDLTGLTLSPLLVENKTAKFNLILSLEQTRQGLMAVWEYNTDLFDASTIERMAGHFQILLEGIVTRPQQHISELPLLTVAEQHQLLVEWNDTQVDYALDQCIHELFEVQSKRTPDAVAMMFENQQLTYRELNERANKIAHYLRTLGVGPDVLVGICVGRSLLMVLGLLGILKAGGAYVPLDPEYPTQRLRFILEDAAVSVLLTQQSLVERLPESGAQQVFLDTEWQDISQSSEDNPITDVQATNLAYVIYTSGSTGTPKGVLVAHTGLLNLIFWHKRAFEITCLDKATQLAGTGFDAAVWELWPYLSVGASIYLVKRELLSEPLKLQDWLITQKVTITFMPTPLAQELLSLGWTQSVALRCILTGGDKLNHYPSSLVPFQFVNNYGPTENTVVTTSGLVVSHEQDDISPPIGRPIANTQVHILDSHLQPVPIGVPGELHIGGASLARGYLNRQELTAEKFIPNPFSTDGDSRLYKTGDLARYLSSGNIEYLGRIDNQVKIRGFRIELGEIEAVLNQHLQVHSVVVIARQDQPGAQCLVAYIVPQQHTAPTISELRQFLKTKLPEYMVPSAFVMLESLPLTSNGKVDCRALPSPDKSSYLGKGFVPPRTQSEKQLAQIWSEILNVQPVGIKDNFFELGGHSLMAVRLIVKIEQEFGKNLLIATLFQFPTIEDLANHLRTNKDAPTPSNLVPIQPKGNKTPLFCVHPVGGDVLCYADLAYHLGDTQPFWALRSLGIEGEYEPLSQIEDMAATYIKALQTIQPQGPYQLAGWSMGGAIAFEMAVQLVASGQKVSLLALIDSYAPIPLFKDSLKMDETMLLADWVKNMSGSNLAVSVSVEKLRLLEPQEQFNYVLEQAKRDGLLLKEMGQKQASSLFKVFKANRLSLHSYIPQLYSGQITLFCASQTPKEENQDPTHGWGELARGGIDMHNIVNDHFSIIKTQVLAELLKADLAHGSF